MLNDLSQYVGGDLSPSSSGDLQAASGTLRGQQRVLRRLLTNPGDYVFHKHYGAGLPKYVGSPLNAPEMKALILGQMLMEDAVAHSPTPAIEVKSLPGGAIAVSIQYYDAHSGDPVTLRFDVSK